MGLVSLLPRPARRFAVFVATLLALVVGLSPPLWAKASRNVTARVTEIRPTQMEVGVAAADAKLAEWKADARDHGMSIHDYAEKVLKPKMAGKVIEGIVDPKGHVRITDGHHRTLALTKLEKETGVKFSIQVAVLANYTGMSSKEYAHQFLEVLKKGHFTAEAERLPPEQRIKMLPETFDKLVDNPMRSAVDAAMEQSGVEASDMKDYIQLHAGDAIMKRGLLPVLVARGLVPAGAESIPPEKALDPEILDVISERLFTDPETVDFLKERARPGREKALAKAIDKVEVHVAVKHLAPTKEVDVEEAREKVHEMKVQGWKRNMSVREYMEKVVAPELIEKPVEVVIDPSGKVRTTKQHQRLAALRYLENETGVNLKVKVEVVKNFTGYEETAYAKELGKVLAKDISPGKLLSQLEKLPRNFDNAMTSPHVTATHVTATHETPRETAPRENRIPPAGRREITASRHELTRLAGSETHFNPAAPGARSKPALPAARAPRPGVHGR